MTLTLMWVRGNVQTMRLKQYVCEFGCRKHSLLLLGLDYRVGLRTLGKSETHTERAEGVLNGITLHTNAA